MLALLDPMQAARQQQSSRYPDLIARFGNAIDAREQRSVTPLQRALVVRRSAAPHLTPECRRLGATVCPGRAHTPCPRYATTTDR